MIARLRPVPEPPHDPRSLLLNGTMGFRATALQTTVNRPVIAEFDAERGALVLPRLPAAVRDLAEPSGSLGGIRPPSNVALGPDGSIYLLDRTHHVLKRFDPCTCIFTAVPHVGGVGGGARQFRNPNGITIACGNLYVCDTGLEEAPPVSSGGDQAAADATMRAENHRVSVFTLNGFALRGHLIPPASRLPWRPVAVAVDSLGRAWVGDANGRLHRFVPSGAWENSWPLVPAPAHVAIDRYDRVYVIAPGMIPALTVLDRDAKPLRDPPQRPGDVRTRFPKLHFLVDKMGRLRLEACCDPSAICKADAHAELVFDADGNAMEVRQAASGEVFERAATYRSEPLDSRTAQCVWHRVELCAALPAGSEVKVRAFCADELWTNIDLDSLEPFDDCAVATAPEGGGAWDCLMRAKPGRYLWLELALKGNGLVTPAINSITIEFPRIGLRRYLPAVFGAEPVSADFTDRFLALFDTVLRSIEYRIDRMASLFDPESAPAVTKDPRKQDYLSWLASWIGIVLDRNWDVDVRRRLVAGAGRLFDRRGTLCGLRNQLLTLLGFDRLAPCPIDEHKLGTCVPAERNCAPAPLPAEYEPPPLVLEHFRLRRWLWAGKGRLGQEAFLWGESIVNRSLLGGNAQAGVTRLDASPDPERDPFLVHANRFSVFVPASCPGGERTRKAVENLVKAEAPAGTRWVVHFVEPRFRIGIQSMLGFDAVVGAIPQGVTLGETPLGAASILTSPAHRQGGPAITVGKEGRVGTTMRLG